MRSFWKWLKVWWALKQVTWAAKRWLRDVERARELDP